MLKKSQDDAHKDHRHGMLQYLLAEITIHPPVKAKGLKPLA